MHDEEVWRRPATIDYARVPTVPTPDASAFAIGAVLSQCDDDGCWRPVAFFSGSLLPAEVNYDIYDRELLAIVKAFKHWRHHLLGAHHTIEIFTDHLGGHRNCRRAWAEWARLRYWWGAVCRVLVATRRLFTRLVAAYESPRRDSAASPSLCGVCVKV